MHIIVAIIKNSIGILQKKLQSDLGFPLLVIYLEEMKSVYCKDMCTHMFIVALATIAMKWNWPRCS
jgi:hypothetical protein